MGLIDADEAIKRDLKAFKKSVLLLYYNYEISPVKP
jgi:hypothetical protein